MRVKRRSGNSCTLFGGVCVCQSDGIPLTNRVELKPLARIVSRALHGSCWERSRQDIARDEYNGRTLCTRKGSACDTPVTTSRSSDFGSDGASSPRYSATSDSMSLFEEGGRWIIVGYNDGSVWYFDLLDDWTSTSALEPKMLLPGWPDSKDANLGVKLAVDWTSEEALGPSLGIHCLTQFNIAVFVRPLKGDHAYDATHIDVWQVRIENGPQGMQLALGEHLSSFTEDPGYVITNACLYGPTLAYVVRIVVVVDWHHANGRTKDQKLSCRCISAPATSIEVCLSNVIVHKFPFQAADAHISLQSMVLLPGNRLLIDYGNQLAVLYNWEVDLTLCDFTPSAASSEGSRPRPLWEFRSPPHGSDGPIQGLASQQPLILGEAIRMVIPTSRTVYGLSISTHDHSADGIQMQTLLKEEKGIGNFGHFSLNRGVATRFTKGHLFVFSNYHWVGANLDDHRLGRGLQTFPNPVQECYPGKPTLMLHDQFTNRVIVAILRAVPSSGDRFCIIVPSTRKDGTERRGDTNVGEEAGVEQGTATVEDIPAVVPAAKTIAASPTEDASHDDRGLGIAHAERPDSTSEHIDDDASSRKAVGSNGEEEEGEPSRYAKEPGEPDSDAASESGFSDDEISWKGVGSGAEDSDDDTIGTVLGLAPKTRVVNLGMTASPWKGLTMMSQKKDV
ncbi:hypothetical protein NMY22_g926 [Coprinellus aureogranulatus]|nr:hypothetical protein NMY22_g926 [Coprinellus aureogranulatus]